MLQAATVQTLDALAQRSDAFYTDGGSIYTFTEAANQAHCKFPKEFAQRNAATLTAEEFARLALVITKALGNLDRVEADAESYAMAELLLQQLQTDLAFSNIGLTTDDDDWSWGATIHMACAADNRYFSLYLWGSID